MLKRIELKFTSIAYIIGGVEITGRVYLVLTSGVASFPGWLERKTYVPGVTNV
ncbi:MAG: hypothetical protein L0J73_11605 [Halomonas sp.]|nr:hypothetical protein [Halomonas sp.]